jgi:energy-coupling factor transport system permease protein
LGIVFHGGKLLIWPFKSRKRLTLLEVIGILPTMLLFEYNPKGKLAAIGAETKFIWAIGLSVGILFCQKTLIQLILAVLLAILLIATGVKPQILIRYIKLLWPALLIIFCIHLFYHSGNVLFQFWILKATDEGVKAGLFNILRFLNFSLLAIAFIQSVSPIEFSRKLSWILGLFRIQFLSDLALIFFIALRFMPVMAAELSSVKMAMIARGANFKTGLKQRMRLNLKLLLPLFSRVIRQSDEVASAIALKSHNGRYFIGQKPSLKFSDFGLIIAGLSITVTLILL